jgi:DNA-binding transcriptional ArsR family regulator
LFATASSNIYLIKLPTYKASKLTSVRTSLQAVGNPYRREILRLVWDAEMTSREIASHFDVTWQAVSHNLRVLREAGLISERRDGTRRLYRTARDQLGPLEALLRDLWRQDLKRLEKVIEHDQAEGISE